MKSLLENQKIAKRKYYGPGGNTGGGNALDTRQKLYASHLASPPGYSAYRGETRRGRGPVPGAKKTAFRPAGLLSLFERNSRFIENINQNPERTQQKIHKRLDQSNNHSRLNHLHNEGSSAKEEINTYELNSSGRRFPSLALPAIPLVALMLLVTGLFFVNNRSVDLDWMNREVISSERNQTRQHNLALYAGIIPIETNHEILGDVIPLDLMETFAWQYYTVQRGDSVSRIAANFSISMDAIIALNGITNARTLREGEVLRIPNMDGIPFTVRSGDTLSGISASKGVPLEAILDANDIQSDVIYPGMTLFIPGARMNREDLRLALGELFIHPVRGARLTSPFGWRNDPFSGARRFHAAIDLAAPQGTPIRAAMEGRVSAVGFNSVYGNFIILGHPGGFQTLYAHLHTVTVRSGDRVNQGAQIGTVGNTGLSTGPHLHFAVYRNGRAVNPLDFINTRR